MLKNPWIALLLSFEKLEIGSRSLFLIFTLGQTGGIMGMTLFELCHLNNSNWQGKVLSHQHVIGWLDNLPFLVSLNFRSSQWLGSGEKNNASQVCNYIFTCWQNSSEKVTSCQVLCFQPCSPSHLPPLATHLSSLSNGAPLDAVWDLSELVKVRHLFQR